MVILLVFFFFLLLLFLVLQIRFLSIFVVGDVVPLVGDEVLAVHVVYDKELEIHFPR